MELEEMMNSMYPFTKTFILSSIVLSIVTKVGYLSPYILLFYPSGNYLELWRYITCILFLGPFNMKLIFTLVSSYMIINSFEESLKNNYGKFLYVLTIMILFNFVVKVLLGFSYILIGMNIIGSFVYIYCRNNPEARFKLFYIFSFTGRQFILVYPLVLLLNGLTLPDIIISYLAGHLYYFFNDIIPNKYRINLIKTPKIFDKLGSKVLKLYNMKVEDNANNNNIYNNNNNQNNNNYRPFGGRGMQF